MLWSCGQLCLSSIRLGGLLGTCWLLVLGMLLAAAAAEHAAVVVVAVTGYLHVAVVWVCWSSFVYKADLVKDFAGFAQKYYWPCL